MVFSALKRAYARETSQKSKSKGYFNCSTTADGGLKFEKFTHSKFTPGFLKLIGCWTRDPQEFNYVNAQAFGIPDLPELSGEYNSVVDRRADGSLVFCEEKWQKQYDEICELTSQLDDGSSSPVLSTSPPVSCWYEGDQSEDRLGSRISVGNELEGLWPTMKNPFSLLDNLHEMEEYSQYNSSRRLYKQKARAAEDKAKENQTPDVTFATSMLPGLPAEAQRQKVGDVTARLSYAASQSEQPVCFELEVNDSGKEATSGHGNAPAASQATNPLDSHPAMWDLPSMVTIVSLAEPTEFRAPIQSALDGSEDDVCKVTGSTPSTRSSQLSYAAGDDSKPEPRHDPERRLSSQSTSSKRVSLPRWQDLPSSPSQVGRSVSLKENLLHRQTSDVEAKDQPLARSASAPTKRTSPPPTSPIVKHDLQKLRRRLPRAPPKKSTEIQTIPVMILSDVNQEEATNAIVPYVRIPDEQWADTIGSWPTRLGDMIIENWYAGASVGDIALHIKSKEWDFVDVDTGEEIDVEVTIMRFLMTVGLWGSIRRNKSQRTQARRDSIEEVRVDRLSDLVYKRLAKSKRFAEEYHDKDS